MPKKLTNQENRKISVGLSVSLETYKKITQSSYKLGEVVAEGWRYLTIYKPKWEQLDLQKAESEANNLKLMKRFNVYCRLVTELRYLCDISDLDFEDMKQRFTDEEFTLEGETNAESMPKL